jgi:hypothetical protein
MLGLGRKQAWFDFLVVDWLDGQFLKRAGRAQAPLKKKRMLSIGIGIHTMTEHGIQI